MTVSVKIMTKNDDSTKKKSICLRNWLSIKNVKIKILSSRPLILEKTFFSLGLCFFFIRELKHGTFLRLGQQPEVRISHTRAWLFESRFN